MPTIVHMPAVAAGAAEVVLSEWSVVENASFAARDVFAVLETEKATVDLEAEQDGVLLKALVPPGARVEVGDAIAVVGRPGEAVDDLEGAMRDLGVTVLGADDTTFPERREVPDEAPRAVGTTVDPLPPKDLAGVAAEDAGATPVPGTAAPAAAAAPAPPAPRREGERVFASPLARRLARDAGLDHRTITGTGPGGRIVRRDVEAALVAPSEQAAPAAQPPAPSAVPARSTGVRTTPHSRIRTATAARLVQSKRDAPHFYVKASCRVDALLALRRDLVASTGVRISVNDLVVKAVARAHEAVPEMNVIWTDEALEHPETVDVAVAVATERALLTPVLTDVAGRRLTDLSTATRDLVERAQSGKLRQHELEGGTVAVSNMGMLGVEEFSAIINPPQSSILAVGAARPEPVVVDGAVEVATVMRVVLSVDHRPIDGAVAARWMQSFVRLVESPTGILA